MAQPASSEVSFSSLMLDSALGLSVLSMLPMHLNLCSVLRPEAEDLTHVI